MRNTVSFCAAFLAAVATVRCDSRSAPIAPTDAGTVTSGGGGSSAVCTFRVPKTPKHASVHATVTVTAAGQSATASFIAQTK